MMAEAKGCPRCGRITRGGALDGLCPACVAQFSLALSPGPEDAALPSDDEDRVEDLFGGILGPSESFPVASEPGPSARGPAPASRPRRFGDYELLEEIGRGGMGIVYRARQCSLNRIVAVKMIPFGALASEESIRRFRTEAEAAAQLRHPHIVAIHEIGVHEGQHFFSMDFVGGTTLADGLRDGPWASLRAAACLHTVAEAVHHAHQKGILHRDLKPANILLDERGEPHVADFGLARNLVGDSTLTVTGQVLGSPHYMPPEQAAPAGGKLGPPTDVYSLGAVLYHLLTGRPPFQAESLEAVLAQVTMVEPVPPRLLNAGVPRDLQTICLKCLEKEAARRYGSAEDLARDLGCFLRNEPIKARPAGMINKVGRWCRRRPALATTLALLGLVGVMGATGVLWQWRRAEGAHRETRRNLYAADMALAFEAFARGDRGRARQLLESYRPGPDASAADLRGWEWRHLWAQCRGTERQILARHPAAVGTLGYSPDGRWLASGDVLGGLQVWQLTNPGGSVGVPVLVTNLPEGHINALAFSPNGDLLAHTTARRHVWLWNTRTSPWQRTGTLNQPNVSELAFAPDSQRLATANGMEVALWDLETGRLVKVLPASRGRPHPRHVAFSADGRILAVGDDNGVVLYWDMASGQELAGWRAHRPPADATGTIAEMAFSTVGQLMATAGSDRSIRLWTAPQKYRPLSNHTDVVTSVAFSPDGRQLASGSLDQTVRLWDVATQAPLAQWHGHGGGCLTVRFAPDGHAIATAGVDGTVRIWDVPPPAQVTAGRPLPPKVRDVMVFGTPAVLAMTIGTQWHVWELPGLSERSRGRLATNSYYSLKSIPSGRLLEFAAREVRGQRLADGEVESLAEVDLGDVLSTDISRDGKLLAVSAVNGLAVWTQTEAGQRKEVRRWPTPAQGWGRHVRLTPAGDALVTMQEQDGTVTFWEVSSGETTAARGASIGGSVLAFSHDGRWLATAGVGTGVQLYDVHRRRAMEALDPAEGTVTALAFSPNGDRLAGGLARGHISIWDRATRREVAVLSGHTAMIYSLAFLPDETLVSATRDEVRLWPAPALDLPPAPVPSPAPAK
jgi:WD40 repeat protein